MVPNSDVMHAVLTGNQISQELYIRPPNDSKASSEGRIAIGFGILGIVLAACVTFVGAIDNRDQGNVSMRCK